MHDVTGHTPSKKFNFSLISPPNICNIQIQTKIKSNHFYCHITTAHVPWWVKFLRACSRQCKNYLHIDSTYLQTYTDDNVQNTQTYTQYTQCTIWHTVINTHYTPYVHIIHYVHRYTQNNMWRCNRLYIGRIRNVMDVRCMVSSGSRYIVVLVQCVLVVQLNCVKVQCMAYRKVGVCYRVY